MSLSKSKRQEVTEQMRYAAEDYSRSVQRRLEKLSPGILVFETNFHTLGHRDSIVLTIEILIKFLEANATDI